MPADLKHCNRFALGVFLMMISCAHNDTGRGNGSVPTEHTSGSLEIPIGQWTNLYKGDPQLAGIELSQRLREGPAMRDDTVYDGRHPAEVAYHFWDGRIRWILYEPDGRKQSEQWMRHADISSFLQRSDPDGYARLSRIRDEETGRYISSWGSVDFSLGSDPQFQRHKDPRRVLDDAVQAYGKRLKVS